LLLLGSSLVGGHGDGRLTLIEPGLDAAPGVLVNASLGAAPADPFDPARPTFVIVHGLNPFHPAAHIAVGPRYAEALRGRYGASCNIAYWDWNGATGLGMCARRTREKAWAHGCRLAYALQCRGADPCRVHLVGQSTGCLVAASAARRLSSACAGRVGRLTLIDPAVQDHSFLFEHIGAGTSADVVDHYWVQGPSGFGAPAPYAGVRNASLRGPSGLWGLINPGKSDHLNAVRWHIGALSTAPN
jgi:pimeloyl-ACP methyl ester carboxylesterase